MTTEREPHEVIWELSQALARPIFNLRMSDGMARHAPDPEWSGKQSGAHKGAATKRHRAALEVDKIVREYVHAHPLPLDAE